MSWIEIIIELNEQEAERYSDALLTLGALSVSVEDADSGTDVEQALFGEPGSIPKQCAWQHSRVTALLAADSNPAELMIQAANQCQIEVPVYQTRPVAEQDWVKLTQSQFEPMLIGQAIWVVPSWSQTPSSSTITLKLDPGLAFGTGSHPTTRLCMTWLEAHPLHQATVLDYGCGSGILAILAKKLGAHTVIGVDIDPQAIQAATNNAAENDCDITFLHSTQIVLEQYDVVVANILTNTLCDMVNMLVSTVKMGGSLVLSGILERQAEQVIAAYAPFITLSVWQEQEGWVALTGEKR